MRRLENEKSVRWLMVMRVAVAATLAPAVRASRTSTVLALADAARPPRRTAWLIAISARLPVPLLLGLRVAARIGAREIVISHGGGEVARHRRLHGRFQTAAQLDHYLELLRVKPGALKGSLPLRQEREHPYRGEP